MSVLTKADLEEILAMLDDAPEYHHSGMGCGLEDRNIHNRYEAMQHGWDSAIERVYGEHVNPAIEAIKAAIEKVATPSPQDHMNVDARISSLEKEIKDLKHSLASAEGRAKNATSNLDYWRSQYDALVVAQSPASNVVVSPNRKAALFTLSEWLPAFRPDELEILLDEVEQALAASEGSKP